MKAERTPELVHTLTRHRVDQLPSIRALLLDIYAEVYADTLDQEFSSVADFDHRLDAYARGKNFEVVIAWDESNGVQRPPMGYAFGYTLGPQAGWWRNLTPEPDPGLVAEDGARTFALNELMVRQPYRGGAVSALIHRALLEHRTEARCTLLVESAHPRVRARYEEWGYRCVGQITPSWPSAPQYDAMVVDLPLPPR